jgi:TPR repeat protein
MARNGFAFWLAFSFIALSGPAPLTLAADAGSQALPPPVPFYSAHVSNTEILGAGIIVITTQDSFDSVLGWYRANLKDQMADVAVGPNHHHFLTHNGAGVDVSANGEGATKISLLWNAGADGPFQSQPPPQEATAAPTAKDDRSAEAEAPAAPVEIAPIHSEPLSLRPAGPEIAMAELPRPKPVQAEPAPVADPSGLGFFKTGQYAEALLAWEKAAAAGSVEAPLFIGMMFDTGQGVPASATEALAWYRKAADRGNPIGLFNVGAVYDGGFGVRRDPTEAVDWYSRAAVKGSGRAAFNLALLFETGDGVAQDDEIAAKYFKQAERMGVKSARSHLGRSVRDATASADADLAFNTVHDIAGGAPKSGSATAAAETDRMRRLADKSDPAASYDLAYRLENGIGADIDLREAYALYRQAAAGTTDPTLTLVAEAGAAQVQAHLDASEGKASVKLR